MTRMLRFSEEQFAALTKRKQAVPAGSAAPAKRPKYNNRKTEVDGILFDSAREAKRYRELGLLHKAGEISKPMRQVRFPLPGKTTYVADFVYFELWPKFQHIRLPASPRAVIEDVKGVRTPEYKLKAKLMFEHWGIAIKET